jgi:phospholipid/cholesterol/gamma-HCH transport system substrate-binding protein
MESKLNYTIVGLFVVILTTAMFSFAYWLTKSYGVQVYDTYYVHLTESVAGLNIDAAVKYRGVDVGTVTNIGINPENPEEVRLALEINRDTHIKTDTTAAISYYGITGLAFIELKGMDKNAPLLKVVDETVPVIPSRPSAIKRIDQSLSQLAEKSAKTLDNINRLFGDKNLKNIEDLLIESKGLVTDLRSQLDGMQTLMDKGLEMESKIISAADKVGEASTSIKLLADNLEKNTTGISQEMSTGMRDSFSALTQLLSDLDILTISLQSTINDIKTSPGDLLFKRTQTLPGPGEEGYHEK